MTPTNSRHIIGGDLAGRTVLVTGSSSGIGAAIAVGFGSCGAKVAVHYNRNERASEVAERASQHGAAEVMVVQADFLQPGAPAKVVRQVADRFGALDILVNNVGDIVERRPLTDIDDDYLREVMQLNFFSLVNTCQAAMPLIERSQGVIINITSVAAETGGGGNSSIYAAAKAAANSFTRALAKDYASSSVRVNAVSPGVIETAFHDRHTTAESMAARRREVPLGRLGVPEDCVGAALFLASPSASGYITGQILEVNGGRYMR